MTGLVRYSPYETLRRMQWEMDRFFDQFMTMPRTDYLAEPLAPVPFWTSPLNRALGDNLAIDMSETDDALIVRTSLPGIRPEDVVVEARDGWLSIRAQSQVEQNREQAGWFLRERRYGAWQRTLRLPTAVNVDKAEADLHNGVLTIKLPKTTQGKPLFQRIKVNLPKLSLPKLGLKKDKIKVKAA
ncbi:MAG TPA: Hsp20/alpha crystallin family protein [Caldilineaceae bacterium]|nr:Hsp20/alpha crystallin family protein [Caldilineaceae bacterium]